MNTTWQDRKPVALQSATETMPTFSLPYLSHRIPAEETQGVVIDCDGLNCMKDAEFWVSSGGKKKAFCSVHEFLAHSEWHGKVLR